MGFSKKRARLGRDMLEIFFFSLKSPRLYSLPPTVYHASDTSWTMLLSSSSSPYSSFPRVQSKEEEKCVYSRSWKNS